MSDQSFNAFIDTSVVLRPLLNEPDPLTCWRDIGRGYVSRMLIVEVRRTIDRYRLQKKITDDDVAFIHESFSELLETFHVVHLSDALLESAASSMPTVVGTLDAIHLATARALRDQIDGELLFATHDRQLSLAAKALQFRVVGVT